MAAKAFCLLMCIIASTKALSPLAGCLYEGAEIEPGTDFHRPPCDRCFCPSDGGEVQCIRDNCPDLECVDSVHPPDQCCPVCPNGPNCYAGDDIIPAGEEVVVGNMICGCDGFGEKSAECRQYGCLYEEIVYPPGESFKIGDCADCHCPQEGGEVSCAEPDCAIPFCADPQKIPGICCPLCPNGQNCYAGDDLIPGEEEVVVGDMICWCVAFDENAFCKPNGCSYKGAVYPLGQPFLAGDCNHCYCSPGGGIILCSGTVCDMHSCVDQQKIPGKCCAECPNGPNCYLDGPDGKIIPADVDVEDGGRICRCPEFNFGFENVEANCFVIETTTPPGCLYEGNWYAPGTHFGPPCELCECLEDGESQCMIIDCWLPNCVDAQILADACCANCPNGENCYHGTAIITTGVEHQIDGQICVCPDPPEGFGSSPSTNQAECITNTTTTSPPV